MVHILRQHLRGGGGVREMLTFSDMGGGGVQPSADVSKNFFLLHLQQIKQEKMEAKEISKNGFTSSIYFGSKDVLINQKSRFK